MAEVWLGTAFGLVFVTIFVKHVMEVERPNWFLIYGGGVAGSGLMHVIAKFA